MAKPCCVRELFTSPRPHKGTVERLAFGADGRLHLMVVEAHAMKAETKPRHDAQLDGELEWRQQDGAPRGVRRRLDLERCQALSLYDIGRATHGTNCPAMCHFRAKDMHKTKYLQNHVASRQLGTLLGYRALKPSEIELRQLCTLCNGCACCTDHADQRPRQCRVASTPPVMKHSKRQAATNAHTAAPW